MTTAQRSSKTKSVKAQKLRLKVSEARSDADHAIGIARSAKAEFKKARKAFKLAKKAAKESRKTLKALMRKLKKIAPAKIQKTEQSKRATPPAQSTST